MSLPKCVICETLPFYFHILSRVCGENELINIYPPNWDVRTSSTQPAFRGASSRPARTLSHRLQPIPPPACHDVYAARRVFRSDPCRRRKKNVCAMYFVEGSERSGFIIFSQHLLEIPKHASDISCHHGPFLPPPGAHYHHFHFICRHPNYHSIPCLAFFTKSET